MFVIWIGTIYMQVGNATHGSQWIYDVYDKKTTIANSIKKEKIVIVAGSNALFGINSKMLRDAFDKPVVNYAVNAGVLLPYIFYKAKTILHRGDTVILPLEYSMYNYDGKPNTQMIDYIFSRDFNMFYNLSFLEQFYMIWNVGFGRLYDGYVNSNNKQVIGGLYGAHNIDMNGDQMNNELRYKSKGFVKQLNNYSAKTYGKNYNKNSLGFVYMKEFNLWCKENDVKCVFVPCAFMKYESYFTDKKERWFYENIGNIIRNQGMEFVGKPYDYMFEKKFYFNTIYHLNSIGRDKMTEQIIMDLKDYNLFLNSM